MTKEQYVTQGNVSYLPWVTPFTPESSEPEPEFLVASVLTPSAEAEDVIVKLQDLALRALGRRDYSRKELQRYLENKHESEADDSQNHAAIVEVLDRLEQQGWLNEDRAIEHQLSKSTFQKLGKQGKRQKLLLLGYGESAIARALNAEADDEQERLLEIATQRLGQLGGLDQETAQRRLTGFLLRRGFAGQQVNATVRALFAQK